MKIVHARRVLVGLLVVAGCHATRHAQDTTSAGACSNDQRHRKQAMQYARSLMADRLGENLYKLPWVNTSPPALVTDPGVCAEAARRYSRMDGTDMRITQAVVVAVGGLYVVQGNPMLLDGEFVVTLITDDRLRTVQRHLGG